MRDVLVDTGPLVAILSRRDRHHRWARDALERIEPPLHTCEAVLSEACFLLRKVSGGADAVLAFVDRGLVRVSFRMEPELVAVRELMSRYAAVPMSLADACLVRMTELDARATVLSLDSDFRVYRRNGRQAVPALLPE